MSEAIPVISAAQRVDAAMALCAYGIQTGRAMDVEGTKDYLKKLRAKKGVLNHPMHSDVCDWAERYYKS